jgi:hypothetical protein
MRRVPFIASALLAGLIALVLTTLTSASGAATMGVDNGESATGQIVVKRPQAAGFFTFEKNLRDPSNSVLTWEVWRTDHLSRRLLLERHWRASSGDGSRDDCYRNHGWLPNGWYGGTFQTRFVGKINGVVWQLDDKRCKDGTPRTELFIHSEMTPTGDQNCRFEPQCWDGPNDYLSEGCIKLDPSDTREIGNLYQAFYGTKATDHRERLLLVTDSAE